MSEVITIEKIESYLELTAKARAKVTPKTSSEEDEKRLKVMMRMCDDYISDATHLSLIHI